MRYLLSRGIAGAIGVLGMWGIWNGRQAIQQSNDRSELARLRSETGIVDALGSRDGVKEAEIRRLEAQQNNVDVPKNTR